MYGELLRLAKLLAADGSGHPRWVTHNRAVSTAYYALFHAVAELCARELVGAWRPFEPFRHIYRSLDHGQARNVFRSIRGDAAYGASSKDLAQVFIDLQAERHSADYDPGNRVSVAELRDVITRAEFGTNLIDLIPASERRLLAARLIGRNRSW